MSRAGGHGQCCVLFLNAEFMDCQAYLNDVNNFLTVYRGEANVRLSILIITIAVACLQWLFLIVVASMGLDWAK